MNLISTADISEWILNQREVFSILDNIKMFFFIKGLDNNFLWVNKSFAQVIGKPQEEIMNKSAKEVFGEIDKSFDISKYEKDDLEVIKTKLPKSDIIEQLPTINGLNWIRMTKLPLLNKDNKIIGIIGISFDVTDQFALNKEFELLLDSLSDSLIITDHSGMILKVYKGKTGLIHDYNEHIGKNINFLFASVDFSTKVSEQLKKVVEDINNKFINPFGYYFEFSTKDKQYEITIDLFNHSKLVFSIRDISLRKKLDKFDHLLEEVRSMNSSMIRSLITE